MRAMLVVVVSPRFDDRLCVVERLELMHVQALVAQAGVEGFNVAVVRGFAGSREVERDAVRVRPGVDRCGDIGAGDALDHV